MKPVLLELGSTVGPRLIVFGMKAGCGFTNTIDSQFFGLYESLK